MSFEDTLKGFIEENLVRDKSSGPVAFDESLMERGVLDSLGLMNLIAFIEEKTGVRIADDEVMLENFETINAIVATIDRARTGRAAGSA
jgi:acyl carrier protein